MISAGNFLFRKNFPGLTDAVVDMADMMVLGQWSGMFELWAELDPAIRDAKRLLMENYLLAHWLAVNYPGEVEDAISQGAIPLASQDIGGVALSYKELGDVQGDMKVLTTTQWGIQALLMYQGAPERFQVL